MDTVDSQERRGNPFGRKRAAVLDGLYWDSTANNICPLLFPGFLAHAGALAAC